MKDTQKPPSPPPVRTSKIPWLVGAVSAALFVGLFDVYDKSRSHEYTLCSTSQNIYTVDEARPRVECISVKGSRIEYTGTLDEIKNSRAVAVPEWQSSIPSWALNALSREPRVFHVGPNSIVVPGLADAHAHILENGFKTQLPLESATSASDVIRLVKEYVLAHPEIRDDPTQWIGGMGWDQTKWPGQQFPTASEFDQEPVLKGRLIVLRRVDGHAIWVSPRVLEVTKNLPSEIDGGLIMRDESGQPTGIFVDNAIELISEPQWTEDQMSLYFETTMSQALAYGLTSIHDAASLPEQIKFFKKKAEDGKVPMRLYLMGNVLSDEYWGSEIPRLINHGKHGRLNVRSIKMFTDGALGSWGAALLKPYSDKPDTTGLMRSTPEALSKLVKQFYKDGWQVNIHCIGDRANNAVLDIFEDVLKGKDVNVTQWRPRIEHAQIMSPKDLDRIGTLGVIASVQPTHATSDMWYAETRLGPERILGAYAYQTLLQGSPNNVLPLGSDFPVEGVNPLLGFYAVISRLSVDGTSPHGEAGWYPDQRLTRAQALKGMTLDAAYASFAEHDVGSLSPGKKADFVVLNQDIMTIPVNEILKTQVSATVIDGKVMYGKL